MTDIRTTVTTAATGALLDILDQQPWYRRFAGTITTAAGGVATLGTWALSTELGLPRPVQLALGVLVMVAGIVAARATRNGATPRGDGRVLDVVIPAVVDAIGDGAESLDRLVREQGETAAKVAMDAATRAAQQAITAGTAAVIDIPGAPDEIAARVKAEQERLMRDVFGVGR
jgi:hypothetical protein